MNKLIQKGRHIWGRIALASMLLVAMPLASIHAQGAEDKPVAVVSISPVKKVLDDVQYLADAANQGDFGRMAAIMSSPFTQGIDKTRPIGVVLMTDGQQFKPFGFIPVSDFDSLLLIVKEQFGPPQDMGDDIKLLATPVPLFVKKAGDWAYVSNNMETLGNVPEDPASMLKDLPTEYDLAIQAYPGNIPELYRNIFLEQLKEGIRLSLQQLPDETDEEYALRKAQLSAQMDEINKFFTDTSDLTIGWNVDASQQGTYLDILYTANEGTDLAKQVELSKNLTTEYSGFTSDSAAVSLQMTSKLGEADIERVAKQINDVRDQAIRQLESEGELEGDDLESAKKIIDLMVDTGVETIRTGTIDYAMMADLPGDKLMMVGGIHVADGARVEDGFKEMAKLLESEEDFPPVKWDAETYQGIRFHMMDLPLKGSSAAAKATFGDKPVFVLGVGERSVYFALGTDATTHLKKAIDASLADTPEVSPGKLHFSLLPILKLVQKNNDDNKAAVDAAIAVLNSDNDKILLTTEVSGLMVRTRIFLQEGLIKAIGAGAAAQNAEADEFDEDGAPAF
ncbi:hypothetical protein [Blastopirellula marina]|uniref:DUF1559 domain-containing protein n=1 Tax=Blastopirellula marina TaxID=124 RepID=A0A2S8GPF3_9BACT|nr:hypothetical protein [Blastopirellula marina]PQO46323.1 hypothetical protein C5Y93_10085 [Blastopirellula marina]